VDEFTFGVAVGFVFAVALMAVMFTVWRQMRLRAKANEDQPATTTDPDLRPAVIDHVLEQAATLVVTHGLTAAEYRAAKERLALAVRARQGDVLTEMEWGVLVGVISPRKQADALPVLWQDEPT
jgi:hypothetical protein